MPERLTIQTAQQELADKKYSARDLVEQSVITINQWEPHINAFIEVLESDAALQAKQQDKLRQQGKAGPLCGIPIAIKDIICTIEGHTTAASKILQNFRSPYEATVISKLKKAGAIIIGKTNHDEFAMGASNEYSAFGPARNPWDITKVPGGSSGGSAAAVASGETLVSLGTDTGGSIRQPASFCGVVGVKPTYGRVSRFGAIAYASSFDQIGPIARNVKDTALLMSAISGHDPHDATTSNESVGDYVAACDQKIKGLKVGIPKEFFAAGIDQQVVTTVQAAISKLETLGATLKEISLPLTVAAMPTYYLLVKAEASSNLARYDGLRYGAVKFKSDTLIDRYLESRGKYFGPEVKRSILIGTYALSAGYHDAWYKQASRVRTLIQQEFTAAFKEVDIIAGPVSPEVAFPLGGKTDDPLSMYLADSLTDPASVAGLPAISVPCGMADELPVGLQLIAPHFEEARLFQVAHNYEQSQPWHTKHPKLP